jgi:hypothetical protein
LGFSLGLSGRSSIAAPQVSAGRQWVGNAAVSRAYGIVIESVKVSVLE